MIKQPVRLLKLLLISLLLTITSSLSSFASTTRVTTHIIETQEKRKSTRFTLTEWLRIKERMKMMDVWLAMFSKPEKDKFSPELSLFYSELVGEQDRSDLPDSSEDLSKLSYAGNYGQMQLWLTNIISSTVGIRTLNIDLGVEGMLKQNEVSMPAFSLNSALSNTNSHIAQESKSYVRANSVALRIFGKNIQDSSIVLKYGEYKTSKPILKYWNEFSGILTGTSMGAGIHLYLLSWLGLEGSIMSFAESKQDDMTATGQFLDYGLYIEISLFRIMGGVFEEEWHFKDSGMTLKDKNTGTYAGLKVLF